MNSTTSFSWAVLAAATLLIGLGLAPSAIADDGRATGATFVGSEECMACHDDMPASLEGTPHASGLFAELSSDHGCESCHGPGSIHVDDPESYSMRVSDLSAEEQSATCQSCHSGKTQFFWASGVHEDRGLSCLSCHSVHAPKAVKAQLKEASETEQCFSCHKDIRAETWKTSHHPIREGQISCSDCHNPHGSQTDSMIRSASINDQCYSCHTEKRGPFIWDHPPVREDCMTCHTPHGSNHIKLQRVSVPYLCQRCHVNTRHPGTLYDRTRLADGDSASNRAFERACLNCHAAVHGSNHPSSPYLAQ